MLEVLCVLPSGQVGSGQIGRTTDELWQDLSKLLDGSLGELSRTDSCVLGGVGRESLFPTLWESTLDSSSELRSLLGVFLSVRLEKCVPLLLELVSLLGETSVVLGSLLGDDEGFLGVETELLLELLDVLLLEG